MKTRICALLLVLVLVCTMTTGVMAAETTVEPRLSVEAETRGVLTTVKVLLHDGQGVTNGRIVLSYDAEDMSLIGLLTADGFGAVSVNETNDGQIALAWVGSEITDEDTLMLDAIFQGFIRREEITARVTDAYAGSEKVEIPAATAVTTFNPFIDIAGHWAEEDILKTYYAGLFNGIDQIKFAPQRDMTRAMFVSVLHRMAGEPEAEEQTTSFTDLSDGAYYVPAVAWAVENGITKGISETRFAPNKALSRQEMVTMLYRYADAMGQDVSGRADLSRFVDASSVAGWAAEGMAWAVDALLIEGFPGGYIMARASATRAQAAAILCRYLGI